MSHQDAQDGPKSSNGSSEAPSGKSGGRTALFLSGGLFALYALNVLSGKISNSSEMTIPLNLGDVGEFLTLFAAAICFVIAALQREAAN